LKDESIETDKAWKAAGKPFQGPIYQKRQVCRLRYRKRLRGSENISVNTYTNELYEALMRKDRDGFWNCWRSKFDPRYCTYEQADGCVDNDVTANKFASHFDDLYKYNNSSRASSLYTEYIDTRQGYNGLPLIVICSIANLLARLLHDLSEEKRLTYMAYQQNIWYTHTPYYHVS
jgi:hypothetical protein